MGTGPLCSKQTRRSPPLTPNGFDNDYPTLFDSLRSLKARSFIIDVARREELLQVVLRRTLQERNAALKNLYSAVKKFQPYLQHSDPAMPFRT
jgi:hypothetical protein